MRLKATTTVSSAVLLLALVACNIPDKVCETDPEDNTCSGPDDCVVAFCAAECDSCAMVYSSRQVEEAWCLTRPGRSPNERCTEAAELSCPAGPSVCPRGVVPDCKDGKCVPTSGE